MSGDDVIEIHADGKKVGSFLYKHKRSHRHLFNLAGIELINSNNGNRVDKRAVHKESVAEGEIK